MAFRLYPARLGRRTVERRYDLRNFRKRREREPLGRKRLRAP